MSSLRIRYFSDTFFNFCNMQQCSHYFFILEMEIVQFDMTCYYYYYYYYLIIIIIIIILHVCE